MRTARNLKSFLIGFAFAFSLLATLAAPAHAKPSKENEDLWKVMTYQELMSLPEAARMKYLDGLREAIVEFEKNQRANGADIAWSDRDANSARLLLWKALIQEAEARQINIACPGSLTNSHAMKDAQKKRMGRFICMPSDIHVCPNVRGGLPFKQVGKWGGRVVCYQPSPQYIAQKRAERDRKRAAEALANKAKTASKNVGSAKAKPALHKVAKKTESESRKSINEHERSHTKNRRSVASKRSSGSKAADSGGDESDDQVSGVGGGDRLAPLTEDQQKQEVADKDPESGSAEAVEDANGDAVAVVDKSYDHDVVRADDPDFKLTDKSAQFEDYKDGETKCGPPPELDTNQCNPTTIAEARRQNYHNRDLPHCLMGGNFSHFANGSKRPGNCRVPSEFCYNTLSCRDENGALRQDGKLTAVVKYKCGGKRPVICNPYVFGLKKDKKPFCVERSGHENDTCNAIATKYEGNDGPNSIILFDPKNEDMTKNDPLVDGWNEFAGEINVLCFDKPMADVYCRECQVIKQRLYKLRIIALNKPQGDPNCHKLMWHPNTHVFPDAKTVPASSDSTSTAPAR